MTSKDQIINEWNIQKDTWGLEGWNIQFSNRKRHLGYCDCRKKTISVSLAYMKINPLHIMRDTLLHEVAHAIHFLESGVTDHGSNWKRIARRVGCIPRRCASPDEVKVPIGKYVGVCPACRKTSHFYRKIKGKRSCSECAKKYDPRFELQIMSAEKYKIHSKI